VGKLNLHLLKEELKMSFINSLTTTLAGDGYNNSVTENGAIGYRSTGKAIVDLNFSVPFLRGADDRAIISMFLKAYGEDKTLALKWLFFARDVREGLGERRLFRVIVNYFGKAEPDEIRHLLKYFHVYGRWDDLCSLLNTSLQVDVLDYIKYQLIADKGAMKRGAPISLLAKWLPSINTSSKKTVAMGRMIAKYLNMTERDYRKTLSELRGYVSIVEILMSNRDWGNINYETVPSQANLRYSNAFMRHDKERRSNFLNALTKGEVKINAGTLYPHDIVHKYSAIYGLYSDELDETIEGLWKSLPNLVDPASRTIVVADGSGSMVSNIPGTRVSALSVANALAIYFAERLVGEFENKYITFSENPRLVDLSGANSLLGKLIIASHHNEIANTNIYAVFLLILKTAIDNHMKQEEMPANILIISDMEFDSCSSYSHKLFKKISDEYDGAGYKLPRIVFWNVNSRSGTIPLTENDRGVALVSGFSINIAKMVMSGQLDPYECLREVLMSERYSPIVAV
jgi:hypothetical protein